MERHFFFNPVSTDYPRGVNYPGRWKMTSISTSQLFCPFRAIGLCSNHIPLAADSRGAESFIATAIGRAFHVYLVSVQLSCESDSKRSLALEISTAVILRFRRRMESDS